MANPNVPSIDFVAAPPFFGGGDPNSIVTLSREQVTRSNEYLERLADLVGGLTLPVINPVFPTPTVPPSLLTVPVPTLDDVTWVDPPFPEGLTDTLDVDDLIPAAFTGVAPEMNYGTIPEIPDINIPDVPGVDTDVDFPTLAPIVLPSAPALMTVSIAAFDGITIPTFDEDVPEANIPLPDIVPYTPGSMYTSALLTTVSTYLTNWIVNGGTGINPTVEENIWNRGREREYRQKQTAIDELEKLEALGFALPPGQWLDGRIKIETELGYNAGMVSREVMIEAAKLEQANAQFALREASQLEGRLVDAYNAYEQRKLEAARYATTAAVDVYNARVRIFATFLEAFRARVTAFEARIRGELAKVEAYKAAVDAEQAKAQVNIALVQTYKTQIEASLVSVEVFKAQVGAVQSRLDIERLKIQVYGEQIKGYTAQIGAATARVDAFKSVVSAETSKQEAFRSQVQAYSAQVQAQVQSVQARIEAFKGKIAAKQAEYDGYKANVQGQVARAQSIAAKNSSIVDGYKAEVSMVTSYNEVLTKQWEATINIAARYAEIAVSAAKANADLYLAARQAAIEASKVAAQVSAQLAASALNAVSFSNSVSLSHSNSSSSNGSASNNYSESESRSESTNENTNYNSSV